MTDRVHVHGIGAVRIVYASWVMGFVPKRFVAMTLGRTIHVRGTHLPVWVLRHELAHVRQWERYGKVGFLARYLWQCARYGYFDAPLELEAEAAEWTPPPPLPPAPEAPNDGRQRSNNMHPLTESVNHCTRLTPPEGTK